MRLFRANYIFPESGTSFIQSSSIWCYCIVGLCTLRAKLLGKLYFWGFFLLLKNDTPLSPSKMLINLNPEYLRKQKWSWLFRRISMCAQLLGNSWWAELLCSKMKNLNFPIWLVYFNLLKFKPPTVLSCQFLDMLMINFLCSSHSLP